MFIFIILIYNAPCTKYYIYCIHGKIYKIILAHRQEARYSIRKNLIDLLFITQDAICKDNYIIYINYLCFLSNFLFMGIF